MWKTLFQRIIDCSLLIVLIVFPFSIGINIISPDDLDHPIIAVNISLADLIIYFLFLLWFFKLLIYKEFKRIHLPPLSLVLLVCITIISFVNATSLINWVKESVKFIEYFLLLYLLFVNNFKSISRRTIFFIIYIFTSIILLVAFVQHTILNAEVYLIRGVFRNRNFLGAYLCMTIPIIYNELLHTSKGFVKIWMALILILTLWILVSGSAIFAILVGLGFVSWKYGKKIFILFLTSALAISLLYPICFLTKNKKAINSFLSIYEQGSINKNYYKRLTMLGDLEKNILVKKIIGKNFLLITSDNYVNAFLPLNQVGDRYKKYDQEKNIKNRYIEMLASLNMMAENTLIGIGAGNFQNHIGSYYFKLPKINTAEPGQNNGYLIIGSTIGFFGLVTVVWLLYEMLNRIKKKTTNDFIGIGIRGAVLACIIENTFVYLFTSSLLVPFILLVYLSLNPEED